MEQDYWYSARGMYEAAYVLAIKKNIDGDLEVLSDDWYTMYKSNEEIDYVNDLVI